MKTYMIGYDLHKPVQQYGDLIEEIKDLASAWWHHLDSTWLVNSDQTATQIRDRLKVHLDGDDELLVIRVGSAWASFGLTNNANDWLRNNLKAVA